MNVNHRISNMMVVNDNNSTPIVYKTCKEGIVIQCAWLLLNVDSFNGSYEVTTNIFDANDKIIYTSESVANVNDSLKPIPGFDFNGNKAFPFITTVRINNESPVLKMFKTNELYKISLSVNEGDNSSNAYFLLKEDNDDGSDK